jgi:hypothetical protein
MARINNIVLVHGAFVDGSSWAGLYDILKEDGFDVSVVQNPTISLNGDVAATNLILDEFGADVDPKTAGFWADSQVPFGLDANDGTVTQPAWREKPSWYLVATDDKMILPPTQRQTIHKCVAEAIGTFWLPFAGC